MRKRTAAFFISLLGVACALFLILFLFQAKPVEKIEVYTLPKSGTHLIKSVLENLDGKKKSNSINHLTDCQGNPVPMSSKRVINIRDLRDYFISLKSFTNKVVEIGLESGTNWPGFKPLCTYQAWLSMTDDEQLMALITLDESIPYYKENILNNVLCADAQVKQAVDDPNILITRYESWIGEKGGGTAEAFTETIEKFLAHFGYTISSKKINNVYEKFYGKSVTFDKGSIGRWKAEFKEEHVLAFKGLWNEYLINWGYEVEKDWER
ncbi:MAG: hypothetical protein S4CHLAM123_13050 [Chlamydiales bacterium]|nr:hypothetical protein [Chlamydiales bacterium]